MDLACVIEASADLSEVKGAMLRAMYVLAEASHNYAQDALRASNKILEVAATGGSCAATYTNYSRVNKLIDKSNAALVSAAAVGNVVLTMTDTPDEEAHYAYGVHLTEMIDGGTVNALLESVHARMELFHSVMPKIPAPATRFSPTTSPEERSPEEV